MEATATPAPTATFRCSICGAVSTQEVEMAVCNTTDACGFLWSDEIVLPVAPAAPATPKAREAAAPTARSLQFRLTGIPEGGYAEGDERSYDVLVRGRIIGELSRTWLVAATEGGEPPAGFSFTGFDGRHGEGRTRAAAVLAAWA